jgi:hypothetical protein
MLPVPVRTSAVPEKDRFYSGLVEKCVGVAVDALGRDSVRALLMIGAPARSEVTVVETPGGLYSLSDIDLVCVCRDGSDPLLHAGKLGPAVAALNRELAPVCSGVDVAIKSEAQLAAPAPLISTYELVRSPVVVWGDERVVSALGDIDIADVPNTESLTLMHNRMTEELLLRPTPSSGGRPLLASLSSLYGTAKLVLDSITSHLFIMSNVPTGFGDRVEFFLSDVVRRPESSRLREGLAGFLDELPAWATFKTTGDLGALAETFGTTMEPADIDRLSRDMWNRYIEYADVFWRDILGDVARAEAADLSIEAMSRLYRKLESLPRSVVRTHRMLRPGRAPAGLFAGPGTYYRARLASPRALAYLTAVLTYLSYSDSVDWSRVVGTVRTCCPFSLPRGFASMGTDEQRLAVTERLRLFHHSVLLGRKEG